MNSSAIQQLTWGILCVLVIYVLASSTKRTTSIAALLVLIPFQMLDTRYGSSSVLIAYALAAVFVISGGIMVQMLPALALIVFAYLISLAQANREVLSLHVIFLFQFFSCLVVFLLAYNYARLAQSERSIMTVLVVTNILVLGYCALQLSAGPGGRFVPFGIEAFQFNQNRHEGDARLIGPFGNPGSTAGYFTIMTILLLVELFFATGRRKLLARALVLFNVIGLVATGNRAGFLILLATFPAALFVFRAELGVKRATQYLVSGLAVIAIGGVVAVTYTDFGRMFDRLERVTETQGGVPTTRALTWPVAVEKIKRDPWFGEGPHFLTREDAQALGLARATSPDLESMDTAYDPFPHSLYLYLLRTVGVIGLAAVLYFFFGAAHRVYTAQRWEAVEGYASGLLRAGLLSIFAFCGTQITLEFNRPETMDYGQFIFALVGLLVGVADRRVDGAHVIGDTSQPAGLHRSGYTQRRPAAG